MKRSITLIIITVLCAAAVFAQAPEKFSYQAVVRNASNTLVTDAQVGVRVSILQGGADGQALYVETHSAVTNANGLLTVEIGGGNVQQGSFADIDWANGPFFLKTETDPNGSSSYTVTSTQQLLSVPYALYAKEAGNVFSGDYNDLTNLPQIPQIPADISAFNNDAGYITMDSVPAIPTNVSAFTNDAGYLTSYTEQQILTISNDTIFLTGGSFVKLPAGFDGDYNSLTNRPTIPSTVGELTNDANYITLEQVPVQVNADWNATEGAAEILNKPELFSGDYNDLTNTPVLFSGDYNDLTNTPDIPTVPTDISAFNNDAGYLTSYTEQQILTISNDTIFLTGGSFVKLPAGFDGDYNSLTNRPTIPSTVGELTNDANYITLEQVPAQVNADWNATEGAAEILNKPELFSGDYNDLTNTPVIPTVPTDVSAFNNDAGYLTSFTEQQILTISNDTIFLTGGSFVKLPEATAGFSGDYNDLTNTPTIPSTVGELTNDANYITNSNTSCTNSVDLCELLEKLQQLENQIEFKILTEGVTAVTQNSFTVNGKVQSDGSATVTQRGFVYSSTNPAPTYSDNHVNCGSGTGTYSYTVTGLTPGITYYVRAFATTENGTFYGSVVAVTTTATSPSTLPSVTTIAVTNVGKFRATVSGSVTSDGGESVTQRGFALSTSSNPTASNAVVTRSGGTGNFTELLNGLQAGTTYYVRAFAVNSKGTAYGNQLTFNTTADEQPAAVGNDGQPCPGTPTVTDHEGNVYNTVQIGSQCWTKENMRATTSPSTGTYLVPPIGTTYTHSGKQARWLYNDSATYAPQNYGLLYNWNAAVDTFNTIYGETSVIPFASDDMATYIVNVNFSGDRRGICPQGWHVPSGGEWSTLTSYLGSHENYYYYDDESYDVPVTNTTYIAKALASTNGWWGSGNIYAVGNYQSTNNASGFSAVPAGVYLYTSFGDVGGLARFWSASSSGIGASYRGLDYSYATTWSPTGEASKKYNGYSVRCLRDNDVTPTVITSAATNITTTTATLNGSVSNPDNVAITAQGFEWKATVNGTYIQVTSSNTTMTYNLTGLTANTSYTYRAFVTTAEGTTYGAVVNFTTEESGILAGDGQPCPGTPTVTDHEGNVYNTLQIGTQCWTKENIRTTTSPSTGTYLIPSANADRTYTGKQARWYNDDSATYAPMNYGLLYNWNAAVDTFNTLYEETSVNGNENNAISVTFTGNRRGICPAGWHLPSDAEWTAMTDYVSSQSEYVCGGNTSYIAKALADSVGWNSYTGTCAVGDNQSANNATGFSAVPAGYYNGSSYVIAGAGAYFCSATQSSSNDANAFNRDLDYYWGIVYRAQNPKSVGRSVRCLRD